MRSEQDNLPTHKLRGEQALDIQGRVLRKPYFFTRREHQAILRQREEAALRRMAVANEEWGRILEAERVAGRARTLASLVFMTPKVYCRPRLRWLVKRLVRIQ